MSDFFTRLAIRTLGPATMGSTIPAAGAAPITDSAAQPFPASDESPDAASDAAQREIASTPPATALAGEVIAATSEHAGAALEPPVPIGSVAPHNVNIPAIPDEPTPVPRADAAQRGDRARPVSALPPVAIEGPAIVNVEGAGDRPSAPEHAQPVVPDHADRAPDAPLSQQPTVRPALPVDAMQAVPESLPDAGDDVQVQRGDRAARAVPAASDMSVNDRPVIDTSAYGTAATQPHVQPDTAVTQPHVRNDMPEAIRLETIMPANTSDIEDPSGERRGEIGTASRDLARKTSASEEARVAPQPDLRTPQPPSASSSLRGLFTERRPDAGPASGEIPNNSAVPRGAALPHHDAEPAHDAHAIGDVPHAATVRPASPATTPGDEPAEAREPASRIAHQSIDGRAEVPLPAIDRHAPHANTEASVSPQPAMPAVPAAAGSTRRTTGASPIDSRDRASNAAQAIDPGAQRWIEPAGAANVAHLDMPSLADTRPAGGHMARQATGSRQSSRAGGQRATPADARDMGVPADAATARPASAGAGRGADNPAARTAPGSQDRAAEKEVRPAATHEPSAAAGDVKPAATQAAQAAAVEAGARKDSVQAAPEIRISIGRVEVRAEQPPATPPQRATPRPRGPALSLSDYLKQRNRGYR